MKTGSTSHLKCNLKRPATPALLKSIPEPESSAPLIDPEYEEWLTAHGIDDGEGNKLEPQWIYKQVNLTSFITIIYNM